LTNLAERLAWVADTMRDQFWLIRHLKIRPTDLVLDVGSGGSPNPRANVLCDKFIADATERNEQPIMVDRPFVVGDAERLPFADDAFDFVICSHLLEHVADPGAVLGELQRVARRGYIETPSAEWEKVQGFPFHRWLVSLQDDTLCFDRKPSRLWDEDLQCWFGSMQRTLGSARQLWHARRRVGVYTSLLWERQIAFEIRGEAAETGPGFEHAEVIRSGGENERPALGIAARTIQWLGTHLRRASDRPWNTIEHLLCCPDCRAALARLDGQCYYCRGCGATFPIDMQGRPWLLPSRITEAEPIKAGSSH
jgi:SAM-dependent methyltransferase/uncharacterized protein YbaR (Trm112 family)